MVSWLYLYIAYCLYSAYSEILFITYISDSLLTPACRFFHLWRHGDLSSVAFAFLVTQCISQCGIRAGPELQSLDPDLDLSFFGVSGVIHIWVPVWYKICLYVCTSLIDKMPYSSYPVQRWAWATTSGSESRHCPSVNNLITIKTINHHSWLLGTGYSLMFMDLILWSAECSWGVLNSFNYYWL